MNKAPWIAIAAALLLPLNAAVAVADVEAGGIRLADCLGGRCEGTDGADIMVASNKADHLPGGAGDDSIELDLVFPMGQGDIGEGGPGRDCIDGGGGPDRLFDGPGNDSLNALDGDGEDLIDGGPGRDLCLGDPSDRFVNCENG